MKIGNTRRTNRDDTLINLIEVGGTIIDELMKLHAKTQIWHPSHLDDIKTSTTGNTTQINNIRSQDGTPDSRKQAEAIADQMDDSYRFLKEGNIWNKLGITKIK